MHRRGPESAFDNRTIALGSILGSLVGLSTNSYGRVVSITRQYPRSNGHVRVRGVASSGRYAYNGYGPYGVGAYGALGYNYAAAADLSFKCDVDYRGYVRDVDINRRTNGGCITEQRGAPGLRPALFFRGHAESVAVQSAPYCVLTRRRELAR